MTRNVEEVVRELYEHGDRIFNERIIQGRHVSCSKGCAHCCSLFTVTSLPEAMLIARWVWNSPEREVYIARLIVRAREMAKYVNDDKWWDLQRPCIFLDEENRTCSVYPIRPGCCRWHAVVSPPEECSFESSTNIISAYDSSFMDEEAVALTVAVHNDHPEFGPVAMGPLPLAIIWVLYLMSEGKDRKRLAKRMRGMPTLIDWTRRRWKEHGLRVPPPSSSTPRLPILK
jgi:Fe-S-cluster containining protein